VSTSIWVPRQLGEDTTWFDPPWESAGPIVGGDDALDTDDGDTSYVVVSEDQIVLPYVQEMPFVWERISGTAPSPASVTSMVIDVVYRKDDSHTAEGSAAATLGTRDEGIAVGVVTWAFAESTDWETQSNSVSTYYATHVIDGRSWNIQAFAPGFIGLLAMRITYLRLTMEGGEPRLRQKNRGSIRQKNKAARQDSIRSKSFY
jgi:hypothetical protein